MPPVPEPVRSTVRRCPTSALAGVAFLLAATTASAQDLLDPDVAFKATARLVKPGLVEVRYDTAPGYYLYRDRLAWKVEPSTATLGRPRLPAGKVKEDEFFGRQVIYRHRTLVQIPLGGANGQPVTLTADLQGCADIGVCYPPIRRTFELAAKADK
jgi:thiol:disulfide interchange protein DsbD